MNIMFNKLNGWQRLWVVVSLALGIVSVFYAYVSFPREPVEFIPNDPPEECMKIIDNLKESGKKNIFLDDPLGLLGKEQLSRVWYEEIPEYKACVDIVSRSAEKTHWVTSVVKLGGVWLATITFIYGAGFSVAWVRKGFRQHRK